MRPNRSFLRIWSELLKKSLMENFIFCAVMYISHCTEKFPVWSFKNNYVRSNSVENWYIYPRQTYVFYEKAIIIVIITTKPLLRMQIWIFYKNQC